MKDAKKISASVIKIYAIGDHAQHAGAPIDLEGTSGPATNSFTRRIQSRAHEPEDRKNQVNSSTASIRPIRRVLAWVYAIAICAVSVWFLLLPVVTIVRSLSDPAWRTGELPVAVVRWHDSLSARFAPWAAERLASRRAQQLDVHDVSGTEWPLFSAVLYLWTTESVQTSWEHGARDGIAPAQRYADAIAAAAALIADPAHASWVQRQWGETYLSENNLFYRMLLIGGLDSYERLSDDRQYRTLLATQVDSLGAELDASPHGVVEDYPGESYSVDVLLAYAVIARAQARLGRLDPAWVLRAQRAFSADFVDRARQLPGYEVDAGSGKALGQARGVGLSMMLIFAHELWPDLAADWYARYVERFWQRHWGFAGFREFPFSRDAHSDWFVEVDAGPVLAGFGTAANAFGVGAARARGDMQHAYPLAAEALLAAWPLPNGTLLGPRVVSNATDAPYIGECALLFALSRGPTRPIPLTHAATPIGVWVVLSIAALIGVGDPARRIYKLLRKPPA